MLRAFGSLAHVAAARVTDLVQVAGLPHADALALRRALGGQ